MMAFKDIFSDVIGEDIQCIFYNKDYRCIKGSGVHRAYLARFLHRLSPGHRLQIKTFKCPCDRLCMYIPIYQGSNIYGYVIVLHLKRPPEQKEILFMKAYIDVALKEYQKEQELNKLYDTIRPRAIALSTIHTIHRLLTSTLDMEELIERIARLTLQVMRARYCSMMLLDNTRKFLVPKAVIDIKTSNGKNSHRRYRNIKVGHGLLGTVAKTGKAILSKDLICVPLVDEDIIGILCTRYKINNTPFNNFDMEILTTISEQAVIAIKNAQLYDDQKRMVYGSIKSLAALLDAKSPNTYTHTEYFAELCLAISEEMKLQKDYIRNIHYAALLPDTGRFSIPDSILGKHGKLSKQEFDVIKKRHLESMKIIEPLEFLKPAIPIIMHHHERYDGTGYPDGLKGKDIPIGARIMAVADAFEAMISSRPYKKRKVSIQEAVKEIERNKGRQFDPEVVDAFKSVLRKRTIPGINYK